VVVVGRIRKGAYFDSVTLMTVGKEIAGTEGVIDAAVVMGTKENRAILAASGLLTEELEAATDTDLLIAIKAETQSAADDALASVDGLLASARKPAAHDDEFHPASFRAGLAAVPDANLAMISVAGRYAGAEAWKALEANLHVMLFSDSVPVETEVELKRFARGKGLLVMGPDCGTAILNGVPLAFANVVNRGEIGIVAASGTGLQEISSIISNEGAGISQAIGTGGRDVKKEIGGITFLQGLAALADDPATKVIVLVSKPPDATVLDSIRDALAGVGKPVVSVFLGAGTDEGSHARTQAVRWSATTLEEAALAAVAIANGADPERVRILVASRERDEHEIAQAEAAKREPGRRYLRGLMSGGTFTSEAQVVLAGLVPDLHSNAPTAGSAVLDDPLTSVRNTVVDLGADAFTVGRPHPMIDYSLRQQRIRDEASDSEVAVILLDVVLGYGSNPDPAAELVDVVREAVEKVSVVCSVTGTDRDPRGRGAVARALEEAGAIVMPSNASASRLAGQIVRLLRTE
jgi:FdrA protein